MTLLVVFKSGVVVARGTVTWVELETPTAGTQITATAGTATASGSTFILEVVIVTNVEQMVAWGWDAAFEETMGTATGTATAQGPPADSISVGADETVTSTAPGASTASGLGASIFEEVVIPATAGTATASGSQAAVDSLNTGRVTWVELEFPTAGTQIAAASGAATASGSAAAVEFVVVASAGTATAAGLLASTANEEIIPGAVGTATASGSAANVSADTEILASAGTATASGSTALFEVSIETYIGEAGAEGYPASISGTIAASVGTATAAGVAFVSDLPVPGTVATATATGAWSQVTLSTTLAAAVGSATAGSYDFVLSQGEAGRVTWVQLEVPDTGRVSIYSGAPGVSYAVGLKAGINFTAPAKVGTAIAAGLPPFIASDFTCVVGTATASGSAATVFDGYVAAQVGAATADAYDFYLAEISDPVDIPTYVGTATATGLKSAHPIAGQNHGHATWVQFEVPVYTGATYAGLVGSATARGSLASVYDDAGFTLDAPLVLGVSVQLGLTGTISYSIGDIPTQVGTATAGGSIAGISVDAAFDLDGPLELGLLVQLGITGTLIIQTDIVTMYVGTATAEGVPVQYLDVVDSVTATAGAATAEGAQSILQWADNYPMQVGTATAAGQRASISYSVWCFFGSASAYKTVADVYEGNQVTCTAGTATASGSTTDTILGASLLTFTVGVATASGVKAGFGDAVSAVAATATAAGGVADVRMVAGVFASVGAATAQGAPLTLFWSEFVAALVGRATASGGRADTGLSATPSFFDSVATDERGVTYSLLEQRLRGIIVEMRGGETTSAEKETTTWREDYSGL